MEVGRRERMTESRQSKSYRWWFESHNSPSSSHWLQSTLSELDEKTQAMLTIIEEDADSFAQRAEMYYKKRPILVSMVEDFYRAHRSLAEQFDNLRHDPGARRTSPIARSFSIPKAEPTTPLSDPHKSYDGCLSRLIFNSADGHNFSTFSKGRVEKVMMDHPLKSIDGPFIELGYGSEEEVSSVGSEVDDPVPEFFHGAAGFGEEFLSDGSSNGDDEVKVVLREEIERLLKENAMQKIQLNQKEKVINELSRKISDKTDEVVEMREEIERLRVENAEIYLLKRKDDDDGEEDRQALKLYCSKDEVEKLKDEVEKLREENTDLNSLLKKRDDEKREVTEQTETDVIMKLKEEVEQLRAEKANLTKLRDAELNGLRGTLEVMKMENLVQRELLEQKDEEKREVIRQLTIAIEFQKGENSALKNTSASARRGDKKKNHNLDIASGLKGFAKLFGWSQQGCVVPL